MEFVFVFWWTETSMGSEGTALSLYRKKVLGETSCVEKILYKITSCSRYMPMARQFFFGN